MSRHTELHNEFQEWLNKHPLVGDPEFKVYHGKGDDDQYQIYHLWIPESQREKLYGSKIIEKLFELADKYQLTIMVESTLNRRTLKFYRKVGFRSTGEMGDAGIIHLREPAKLLCKT